jgi:aspartate racemase
MAMAESFEGRFLGVLGGMGPMASAVFMQRLTALTPVESDQQHIPAILWSDPRVPDRTASTTGNAPDPLPWLLNGARHLVAAGARALAIPCNTAHLWYDRVAQDVAPVPVLHIIESVVADLRRQGIHSGCVGVMGTAATLRMGLYQRELERCGYTAIAPEGDDVSRYCSTPIQLVKANREAQALAPVVDGVASLRARGAQAVVLGCTELPIALPFARRAELDIVISDSIDALALAAVDWYNSRQ